MQYGICNLSLVPLRLDPKDTSELVSQILYGECFKVLKVNQKWSRIRLLWDGYEGWIDNKQYLAIDKDTYKTLAREQPIRSADLVDFVTNKAQQLIPIPQGSILNGLRILGHSFEGHKLTEKQPKKNLVPTAFQYENAPYLWGGKTYFGIDCSGFTQMVYQLNGHQLFRDASQQATQGEALSFIEESEPGDLAFFDNPEGAITHVGIILEDHHIIHAHGQVRIDRLDHTGIYNAQKRTHTHKIRVIKRIID